MKREAGFKARRWVVERTHSWMNRFRRILIRWEKKVENYFGMLHLVCAWITYRCSRPTGIGSYWGKRLRARRGAYDFAYRGGRP